MSFSTLTEARKPLDSKLLVPAFPRKKEVDGVHKPNTYRVLFEDAYYAKSRDSLPLVEHSDHLTRLHPPPPANRAPRPKRDLRHNNPWPWNASFLRENVSTMLVPVCHVSTQSTKADQDCWWVNDPGHVTHDRPRYSLDSTSREAFRSWSDNGGADRAVSYRQKFTEAANGVVPVNPLWEKSGQPRVWTEKISYEHQYDSRLAENYHVRGRRHGALVLRRAPQETADALLGSRTDIARSRSGADVVNAQTAADAAADAISVPPLERADLPFRPPNSVPYHRQFVRPQQSESVASLMQPEFRFAWNQARPEPFFTG